MKMSGEKVVEIKDLSFAYDGEVVLRDVNLAVGEGQFVSMIGPNGGGKTTLLKLLLGLYRPAKGSVKIFGDTPEKARHRVGYMPQHSMADAQFPVTVMDVVLTGRVRPVGIYGAADKAAAARALSDVVLAGMEKKPFSSLSGGQRQRVLIARALSSDPDLLLLDEPTANLDFQVAEEFYALLKKLNERLTIVLVSHDLGLVSRTVQSVICVNRAVETHATSELTGDVLNEIYGSAMRLVHHEHGH